jgi:hypothetical protein
LGLLKKVGVGGRIVVDDLAVTITAFEDNMILAEGPDGEERRYALTPADAGETKARMVDSEKEGLFPGALTEAGREHATELLEDLYEARTGFRSGDTGRAREDEPREQYDPDRTNQTQRYRVKAKERGCSVRALQRYWADFNEYGAGALIDSRHRRSDAGSEVTPEVERAIREEAAALEDASDISKMQFRNRVASRIARETGEELVLPYSRAKFTRIVKQILAKKSPLEHQAKTRQSIAARPKEEFGTLQAEYPGEYVLVDSTTFDVFAVDPTTLQWAKVDLTWAMDLCTRSILAFRLTPFGTQGVDLSLLLADLLSPAPMDGRWPTDIPYPYHGVPRNLLLNAFELPDETPLAPRPTVRPQTMIIDRGPNFQGITFIGNCERLDINVQSARPGRGSDKGAIENSFKTVRQRLLEALLGYVGPNVLSRGKNVENTATHTVPELEAFIGRWIAIDHQCRPHDGLRLPEMPHLTLTPNEAYEAAIKRCGFLYVPSDPDLRRELLPTEFRTIGDGGVEIHGLYYDGPAVSKFRGRPSPIKDIDPKVNGKWPIRIDPRDLRQAWFQDPETHVWHELPWRHGRRIQRPFSRTALTYVKELLRQSGYKRPTEEEIATRLARLLHEVRAEDLMRDRRARREVFKATAAAEERRARRAKEPKQRDEGESKNVVWDDVEIPELEVQR